MKATQCSVDGCTRDHAALGYCLAHYKRLKRYGDAGILVRQKGGPCAVDGCDRPYEARSYCKLHYRRWKKHGDPSVTLPCSFWTGDDASYHAMHVRVRKSRGSADAFRCQCGAQAAEWAYDHTDPLEKRELRGGYEVPYSIDVSRYSPMCVPCHRLFDKHRGGIMTEQSPEPTEDDIPDGTQIPTTDDLPDEEGDAGVGDAELDPAVFADGDDA